MSQLREIIVHITGSTRDFDRALRKAARAAKELAWSLRYDPPTEEEKLAFRWALTHVRAGRRDLAVEDLNWLGHRYG